MVQPFHFHFYSAGPETTIKEISNVKFLIFRMALNTTSAVGGSINKVRDEAMHFPQAFPH